MKLLKPKETFQKTEWETQNAQYIRVITRKGWFQKTSQTYIKLQDS